MGKGTGNQRKVDIPTDIILRGWCGLKQYMRWDYYFFTDVLFSCYSPLAYPIMILGRCCNASARCADWLFFHNLPEAFRCEYLYGRAMDLRSAFDILWPQRVRRCMAWADRRTSRRGRNTHNRTSFSCSLIKKSIILKAFINKSSYQRVSIPIN